MCAQDQKTEKYISCLCLLYSHSSTKRLYCSAIQVVFLLFRQNRNRQRFGKSRASQALLYGFDPRDGTETARRLACIGVRFMLPEASCCTTAGRGRLFLGFDVRGFEGWEKEHCVLEPPNPRTSNPPSHKATSAPSFPPQLA